MRLTFSEIFENMQMDEKHVLRVKGREVGFVYYRSGY